MEKKQEAGDRQRRAATRAYRHPREDLSPDFRDQGISQVPPTDISNPRGPISAVLGRRLAEAADEYHDGPEIFFTARLEADKSGDFDVKGPFTRDEAAQIKLPEGYAVFGPFSTSSGGGDTSHKPIRRVTLELDNGEIITFEGTRYDALFWSSSALEKFVVPYYSAVEGPKARQMAKEFDKTDVPVLAHDPASEADLVGLNAAGATAVPGRTRRAPRPARTELRSVFQRRAEALVQRLSEQAPDEALATALEAPSDFGGLARLLSDTAALGVSLETVDPLAEAVARGAEVKQELLRDAGGGWSSPRVAEHLGITRQAVDKRRRAGRLLAVQTGQGDWLYPVCQFGEDGVLPGFDRFLAAFQAGGPWVRLSVLLSPAEEIGGVSPLDALRRGDVEAAARVAATFGEQGGPAETDG